MKKLACLIIVLLSCLILTTTLIAEEVAGVEITSFKYGIIQKDSEGIYRLSKETDTIPYNENFGWEIEYSSKRDVNYYSKIYLPGKPAKIEDDVEEVEATILKSQDYKFSKGNGKSKFHFWYLDPGDPAGKWVEEIYIGGQLYKTITYHIQQP